MMQEQEAENYINFSFNKVEILNLKPLKEFQKSCLIELYKSCLIELYTQVGIEKYINSS